MSERERFWVVGCPRCRTVQVADSNNKSKICAQCSRRFEMQGLEPMATARNAREARSLAAELKMPKS